MGPDLHFDCRSSPEWDSAFDRDRVDAELGRPADIGRLRHHMVLERAAVGRIAEHIESREAVAYVEVRAWSAAVGRDTMVVGRDRVVVVVDGQETEVVALVDLGMGDAVVGLVGRKMVVVVTVVVG